MDLNHQFNALARDTDTPMVRRAVASNVGNFAGAVESHILLSDVVPVFKALAGDDQDSVRLLAVEQAGKVAKALTDHVSINGVCTETAPLTKAFLDQFVYHQIISMAPTALNTVSFLCFPLGWS